MVHVKTSCGFEMDVDTATFNDMELFDAIAEVEKGHMIALPEVVERIVGSSKKALYDCLRGEDGRVPVDQVNAQILEIVNQAKGKNS